MASDTLADRLDRIAAFEAGIRHTPLTSVLRTVGRTRPFAFVYSRLMPKVDVRIARASHGSVTARIYGLPALVITTTGARSGLPRAQPLLYVRDGDDFVVLGTNFGQPTHPGWTANLRHDADASIDVGPETVRVAARQVTGEEYDRLFRKFLKVYPGYADYRVRRGDLTARMFRLRPVG